MDLGFETIGNATLIAYDNGPALVTDPWVRGPAYFGSWTFQHEIPAEQLDAISRCRFVWFSHGHPDHMNPASLSLFKDKKILLPDHIGHRIADALQADGCDVTILKDHTWTPLTERIRVLCRADRNQDGILLVDIGGRLVVDVNDAQERGSGAIRKIIRQYPISFLLRLSGYGGADMINFHDEAGNRLPSPAKIRKDNGYLVGDALAKTADAFGTTYVVPFSSMHRYQRSDSVWANESETELADYAAGFESETCKLLPAYLRYDCLSDTWTTIDPAPISIEVHPPEAFDDVWSDELEADEADQIKKYFLRFDHVRNSLRYVNLRVGGRDNVIEMPGRTVDRGVTFEVPRHSLMTAVKYEIFDDLLIGNFMKSTLHGAWPKTGLYPDFTPYVGKYGDNGMARSEKEVHAYLREYRRRLDPFDYLRGEFEQRASQMFRGRISRNSAGYDAARKVYWVVKGRAKSARSRPR